MVESVLTGEITSHTHEELDPVFTNSPSFGISSSDINNWNTAYGWGNHASAGYLTSITKSQVEAVLTGTITSHNHAGAYEPILGNPSVTGYILSSTTAGVRSWVAPYSHPSTHPWSIITGTPTTLAGYGITDAAPLSHVGATGTAHGVATQSVAGFMSATDKTKLEGLKNIVITSSDESVSITETNEGYDLSAGGGSGEGVAFEYDFPATAKLDDDLMTVRQVMPPTNGIFISIACSADGRFVIASERDGRLWYSANYGMNWIETQPAGNVDKTWSSVKCNYDASVVVAACNGGGRLWKSTDKCATWSEMRPAGDVNKNWGNCLAVSNLGTHIIAGALYGRLYKSDDSGTTWSEMQPKGDTDQTWFVATVSDDGQIMLVATNHPGDIYMSNNGGATFTPLDWTEGYGSLFVSANGQNICFPKPTNDPEGSCLLTSFSGAIDGNHEDFYFDEQFWLPEPIAGGFNGLWMSRNGRRIAVSLGYALATAEFKNNGDWTFHKLRRNDGSAAGIGVITGSDDGSIVFFVDSDNAISKLDMKRINDPYNCIEVDVARDSGAVDPYFNVSVSQGYLIVDSENGQIEHFGDSYNVITLNSGDNFCKRKIYLPASTVRVGVECSGFTIYDLLGLFAGLNCVKILDLVNMEMLDENLLSSIVVDILPQHQSPVGYIRVNFTVSASLASVALEKGWRIKPALPS